MKEIESYQEWKEELERHGKTPEEMVEWARENISGEYAGKLAAIIQRFENLEQKRIQKRMNVLISVTGFFFGMFTRCLPNNVAGFLLFVSIVIIIITMNQINFMIMFREID